MSYKIVLEVNTKEEADNLTEVIQSGDNIGYYQLLHGIVIMKQQVGNEPR